MNRFSRPWWVTLCLSSITVGAIAYLVLDLLTDWRPVTLILVVLGVTTIVDVVTAAWMERIAPTRIDVGPGEKALVTDVSPEIGRVVAGFDASKRGKILIRGEIWEAAQAPGDSEELFIGNAVRVLERRRLMLIVSSTASYAALSAHRHPVDREC